MSRIVKVLLAAGVLISAIAVALIFYPKSSDEPQAQAEGSPPEVVLPPNPAADDGTNGDAEGTSAAQVASSSAESGTPPRTEDAFKPTVSGDRFGSLSNRPTGQSSGRFPSAPLPTVDRTGSPAGSSSGLAADADMVAIDRPPPQPVPTVKEPIRHRIADGDTLASLARKYWGATDQFLAIYQANKSVLSNPDLLPIGKELIIPPSPETTVARPTSGGDDEMVPIRRPPRQ